MADIFMMANSVYLPNCTSRSRTSLNINSAIAGYNYSGFNLWFNLCGCKVSKVLIQKFSRFLKSSCMTSFGLLVFVILSVNVSFACLLNLCLPWAKWWNTGIAFVPSTSDLWLLWDKYGAMRDLVAFVQFKKRENTHGGVLPNCAKHHKLDGVYDFAIYCLLRKTHFIR